MNYKVGVNFKEGKILKIILGFTIVFFTIIALLYLENLNLNSCFVYLTEDQH